MRLKLIGGIILIITGGMLLWAGIHWYSDQNHSLQSSARTTLPKTEKIHLVAMGDMLAHDSVVAQAKQGESYNFTPYFSQVRSLYNQSNDVVFCNPETLATGPKYPISGYPAFNAPLEFIQALRSPTNGLGCNVINLATNHINDKGQDQLAATVANWETLKPLAFSGANRSINEQNKVAYFTKNDVKFAFIAFADYSNNPELSSFGLNNYHDTALVTHLVQQARTTSDIVIVSMHWGTENTIQPNPDQVAASQLLASLGTDIVIGTGPHVLQPVVQLPRSDGGQTIVWYSIGNFLSSQLEANQLTGGIAAMDITKEGKKVSLRNLQFFPTFMSYQWPEADKKSDNLLARHSLQLQPLAKAGQPIESMFPGLSVAERKQFVQQTLGPLVTVR